MTNKTLKIITQFPYLWFVVKYLKDLFLTKCLTISSLINSSLKTSVACNLVIPVLINYYHEIFTSFDNGLEVRSAFLDICKAFDKVWHEGIIFKLKQSGISGEHLYILSYFMSDRKKGLKIVKIRHGPIFMLEFLKDLF